MNLLQHYTLLIPTRNRSLRLESSLQFYASMKSGIVPTIIILDSSSEDEMLLNQNVISKFSLKLDIKHLKYDFNISFFEKVKRGAQEAKTEIIATCADDDYLLLNHAVKHVDFLVNNPDYVYSMGIVAKIHIDEKNERENSLLFRQFFSNNMEVAIDRFLWQKQTYTLYFWGFYRRSAYIKAISLACESNYLTIDSYVEYLFYFCITILGKTNFIDKVGYVMVRHELTATNIMKRENLAPMAMRSHFYEQHKVAKSNIMNLLANADAFSKKNINQAEKEYDEFCGLNNSDGRGFSYVTNRSDLFIRIVKSPIGGFFFILSKLFGPLRMVGFKVTHNWAAAQVVLDMSFRSHLKNIRALLR